MDKIFKKFINEINFKATPAFEFVSIQKAQLIEKDVFQLEFISKEIVPFQELELFMIALENNFKYKTKFNFKVSTINYEKSEILNYTNWIIGTFLQKPHLAKIVIDSQVDINDCIVIFTINSAHYFSQFELLKDQYINAIQKMGFNNFSLELKQRIWEKDIIKEAKKLNLQKARIAIKEIGTSNNLKQHTQNKKNTITKISIKKLRQENFFASSVLVEGEIFDIQHKETKTNLIITQLSITDYEDAIYIKLFGKTKEEKEKNQIYKKGDFLNITGNLQMDSYTKEPTIIAKKIFKITNPHLIRSDDAPNKRIELSIRTRMSTMDGIGTIHDYLNRVQNWKHKAMAIVDTDSLQSFPELYNLAKSMDVKAIFGVSFHTITKNVNAIYNFQNKALKEETYIIFDLETTGLSPIFEDIIEFGAVKMKNCEIIETKHFFIKPSKKISEFTTKLTGITKEDVKDAKKESEAIKDIADYLKGYTIVAHNANFDMGFVNSKLVKYGLNPIVDPIIDSMIVSRIIFPEAKRFRLENVAAKLNVTYDSSAAHRADYDANVLAKIWIRLMDELENNSLNIKSQKDLYEYTTSQLYDKSFSYEVTLLAKNQKGLKELFQITSKALTTNYFKGPKIFFEDLKQRKDILLGSGALNSRLVDKMLFGSKQQIIEEIAHYDYIEIQPLQNFAHLINRGLKIEDLQTIIKFVISEARKQNKIVVATGDVRYLDEKDKIYHDIYINTKGLGGVRHYLFKFHEKNPIYPKQHLLNTEEMLEQFAFLEDKNTINEIVIDNTNKIADMIEEVQVIKDKLYTPKFANAEKLLENLSYTNARKIYGEKLPLIVQERLQKELVPIIKYGFAVIYWISHLLVAKSLKDGYLVGSRGSVGSSFVATMSKITEVNPLVPHHVCGECKYSEFYKDSKLNSGYDLEDKLCPNCNKIMKKDGQNIPFETFLGFEANKVPDIDLNFSGEYQPIIHNEVKRIFGNKHSFRAGTISTIAERMAFGYVKGWMENTGQVLSKAFIEYIAKGVAGTKRTSGQHPGGIIVIPKDFDVEDFTPINFPANDKTAAWQTTHFDFHAIHDNVLKLDLLGHDDPTAIKHLEKLTNINAKNISMSDKKIISLFSSTKALNILPEDINGEKTGAMGIPEFGTRFVRGMLKTAKVSSFGDLISISGLSHGTNVWTNNAETLVKTRGLTLNKLISCRDDIMVDLVNKGLKPITAFQIMENVRKGLLITQEQETMLKAHNVETWYIDALKKIKYLFPKAHATAYVMMAWRVAYFKLYHPLAYYATYFSTRADVSEIHTIVAGRIAVIERLNDLSSRKFVKGPGALTNKEQSLIPIFELVNEAMARGIKFSNIILEKSKAKHWIIDKKNNAIIPPFSTIDGLGDSVASSIIQARNQGLFISKEDLTKRTSINKTSLGKLEELGVLDNMDDSNQIALDLNF